MGRTEPFETPPTSPRQWSLTLTATGPDSATASSPSRFISPRSIPPPLSPPVTSPESARNNDTRLQSRTSPTSFQRPRPMSKDKANSPGSSFGVSSRSPPSRPPRPSTALPNLRPTIILSPLLLSSLPPADRPLLPSSLGDKASFSTSSTSPSYPNFSSTASTSDSRSCYSSPSPPSPCFFAPTSWPLAQYPAAPQSRSPRFAPSPPPQSPIRPSFPSTVSSPTFETRSHRKVRQRTHKNAFDSAFSNNSYLSSPISYSCAHPPSPSPYPPPTAPLPPPPTPPSPPVRQTSKAPDPDSTSNSNSAGTSSISLLATLPPHPPSKTNTAPSPTSPLRLDHPTSHILYYNTYHLLPPTKPYTDNTTSKPLGFFSTSHQSTTPITATFLRGQEEQQTPTTNPSVSAPRGHPHPWRKRHKRHLWMLATAVLVALCVAGILGGVLWRLGRRWR